jgi:hypothetical protein
MIKILYINSGPLSPQLPNNGKISNEYKKYCNKVAIIMGNNLSQYLF